MKQEQVPVTVRILDKEYRVACSPQEEEGLLESARLVAPGGFGKGCLEGGFQLGID